MLPSTIAMAYGGAIYATLPAARLGLSVTPEHLGELVALGREVKWALNDGEHAMHQRRLTSRARNGCRRVLGRFCGAGHAVTVEPALPVVPHVVRGGGMRLA